MNLSLSDANITHLPNSDCIDIPLNESRPSIEQPVTIETSNPPFPRNIKKCGPQAWHLTISLSAISTIALGILGIELSYHYKIPYLREISYVFILGSIVVLSANNLLIRPQVELAKKITSGN